jgi:hypothetical protein
MEIAHDASIPYRSTNERSFHENARSAKGKIVPDFEVVTAGLEDVRTAIEDLQGSVERVESAVQRVQHAIEDTPFWHYWLYGGLVGILLAWGSSLIDDMRESKWYIGMTHGVSAEKVSITEIGYNECAFITAPVGVKPCHHKKEIVTVRWTKDDAGRPVQSLDDGKTWNVFSPPPGVSVPTENTVEYVNVFWTKVDDK